MPKRERPFSSPAPPPGNGHAHDVTIEPPLTDEAVAIHLGDALPPIDVEVAREAYEMYRERGYANGHDVEDWLEAERRVQRRREAMNAGKSGPAD